MTDRTAKLKLPAADSPASVDLGTSVRIYVSLYRPYTNGCPHQHGFDVLRVSVGLPAALALQEIPLNRRQFTLGSSPLLGLSTVGAHVFAASTVAPTVAPAARDLYQRAFVLDCNLGPDLGDSLPLYCKPTWIPLEARASR
jgi:hypothetical protein